MSVRPWEGTMLSDTSKQTVEQATVTINDTPIPGQGVYVPGGYILTAAHCIELKPDRKGPVADHANINITAGGLRLKVFRFVWECNSNIAALGMLSPQVYKEAAVYRKHFDQVEPVRLCAELPAKPFEVHIFTHQKTWISGTADHKGHSLWVHSDPLVCGGENMGSPIVNNDGELVGVVAKDKVEWKSRTQGINPVPSMALPVWILNKIKS